MRQYCTYNENITHLKCQPNTNQKNSFLGCCLSWTEEREKNETKKRSFFHPYFCHFLFVEGGWAFVFGWLCAMLNNCCGFAFILPIHPFISFIRSLWNWCILTVQLCKRNFIHKENCFLLCTHNLILVLQALDNFKYISVQPNGWINEWMQIYHYSFQFGVYLEA